MKKLHKIYMFIAWLIIGLGLIPLSAQAYICLENQDTGAWLRGTYAGTPKTLVVGTCKKWEYVPGSYMLLETFGWSWGHRNETRVLNDGERVIVGGTTVSNYIWAIYPGQCAKDSCSY